jgi:hypothetical protein
MPVAGRLIEYIFPRIYARTYYAHPPPARYVFLIFPFDFFFLIEFIPAVHFIWTTPLLWGCFASHPCRKHAHGHQSIPERTAAASTAFASRERRRSLHSTRNLQQKQANITTTPRQYYFSAAAAAHLLLQPGAAHTRPILALIVSHQRPARGSHARCVARSQAVACSRRRCSWGRSVRMG